MPQTFATSADRDAYIRELDERRSLEGRRAYQRAYYRKLKEEDPERLKRYARKHYEAALRRRRTCPKERARRKADNYRRRLHSEYGLTPEQVQAMLEQQGFRCRPCGRDITDSACVDHCHATGKVRELLCRMCNFALGHAGDDPTRLRALADYLEHHQTKKSPET